MTGDAAAVLLDWANGEAGMPWAGAVRDAVARRLGVTGLELRDRLADRADEIEGSPDDQR